MGCSINVGLIGDGWIIHTQRQVQAARKEHTAAEKEHAAGKEHTVKADNCIGT